MRTCATPGASLLLVACCAAPVSAQEPAGSFEELRLRVTNGDTVFVIDSAGLERQGNVEGLSETSLRLESMESGKVSPRGASGGSTGPSETP